MKAKTQNIIGGVTLAVCGVALCYAFMIGLDKELARQEAQTRYMCEYYGHAINQHYGHDVCPPTPQG
jgi:hypothetical protein